MADIARVAPIHCARCGAPVPLAPSSPTPCVHCRAPVDLPVFHVDLLAKTLAGREHLRAADALWRTLPRPMPAGLDVLFGIMLAVVVLVCTVAWALWGIDVIGAPGRAFVLLVMLPSLIALQLGLELLAYWSPFSRLSHSFSAASDPAFPSIALCRVCGAPLTVPADSIVARCAYCRADSVVRSLKLAAFQRARAVAEEGRAQIDHAIATWRTLRQQREIIRWVGPAIEVPILLILGWRLWDQ